MSNKETFGPIKLVSSPDKPEFAIVQYPPDRIANEDLKNTFGRDNVLFDQEAKAYGIRFTRNTNYATLTSFAERHSGRLVEREQSFKNATEFATQFKDAFPGKLAGALNAKGLAVIVANAGVSGDTASNGLARLDWSVTPGTNAAIVELGANDMLRGVDPQVTRKALDEIMRRLSERKIAVLLAGMRAAPNLGPDYGGAFESIYTDLAAKYDALLYSFFLDGVAGNAKLNQRDGLHPTAAGIDAIVAGILPKAEELVAKVKAKRAP